MLHKLRIWTAAGMSLLAFAAPALQAGTSGGGASGKGGSDDIMSAENGQHALLDTMVKKGLITDQEAEEIGMKMQEDEVQSSNYKINLASSIKKLTLFGDLRLRYEVRDGQQPHGAPIPGGGSGPGNGGTASAVTTAGTNDTETRDRARYRMRVGAKFELTDDWFGGFRLDTGVNNPRSGNVTFGQQSGLLGNNSQGPFGKGNAGIGIGQAYMGWKATDYLTFEIGRMPNPLYTTGLVWDANLPVDGVAEMFKKNITKNIEIFGNFAQMVYSDSTLDGAVSGATGSPVTPSYSDIFMLAEQVGVNVKFNDDINGKLAATVYTYSGSQNTASGTNTFGNQAQPNGLNGPFNGDYSDNTTLGGVLGNNYGINNLNVVEIPAEIDFKAGKLPIRVYEDFAINLDADDRARLASHPGRGDTDGYAYQVGVQVGQAKKKGDWESSLWWQRTGAYSVDPNLVDADIFDGRTNMQGLVLSGTYNFTDAISGTIRIAEADRIDHSVGTDGLEMGTPGTAQDLNLAAIDHYKLAQFDINWKF